MKSAYLYIRVSTDEQADTGYSQRHQDEMLRRYCDLNGITVKGIFFEDHSAKTFIRPEFQKMLLQVRKHKGIVDLVLFTKWDRFSRNAGDAYGMINTLNKLGVEPQAVEQPLNLDIPENKMMLAFYLAAPEVENDRRALNTFSGMRRAQKEGRYMCKAPMGYLNKISADGKKFIDVDREKAPLIKLLFEKIADGKFTSESVFKEMVREGMHTNKNNFWRIIRNPLYCGLIKVFPFKDEEALLVKGQHEPIISESLFYQAQRILEGKKKTQRTQVTIDDRFPLRGFIICQKCGRHLTASSSKGRNQYYDYYHCTNECGERYRADDINVKIISELAKWKPHPAVLELYKLVLLQVFAESDQARVDSLKKVRKEIISVSDRKKKALDLRMANEIEGDDYISIKRECEERMAILEGQLSELTKGKPDIQPMMEEAINVLTNVDIKYVTATSLGKRDIIGSIYPEKLTFNGLGYRTARINEAVQLIFNLGAAFGEIKNGQEGENSDLSTVVTPLVRFSNHFLYDLRCLVNLSTRLKQAS